ncbi:TPA: hypothetical protein O5I88_000653 [Salmonella enterica]|uniref:hypothetical protein n=1 Tax=Salmonella enterica TaxID=28901 RepID=UPI00248F8392|nr:hypothetical protein [Salmonella enterica]BCQ90370.1 hypothetical protein SAML1593_13190 [Salmonella enterica]BCQ94996.1 hypothetical protein SAML1960_13160 [Salmonella enterica]BCQ99736.1 hypothetical protein SAML2008_14450 [Salmonella enterica]HDA4879566.1 hypothetical protein [Salmonella enterica]HDA5324045.1 hypothetical protein [Salmonella enterica]
MSNIDKQALRQTAEKAQEHGVFNMDIHSQTVLALLDELEAAEHTAAVDHEAACSLVEENEEVKRKLEAAEKRIAELEAIKPIGYFAYDTDGGFTNHDTAERAQEEAQNAIEYFRENACDGWSDEVDSVCWGAIIQQAEKVDERPVTSEDKCASHIECYCDYALLPGENSAAGIGKGE